MSINPEVLRSGLELAVAIGKVLLPIGAEMFVRAIGGGDPLDVLLKERVDGIIPAEFKLELEMKAARARAVHAG